MGKSKVKAKGMSKEELVDSGYLFYDRVFTRFEFDLEIIEDNPTVFLCKGDLYQKSKGVNTDVYRERSYSVQARDISDRNAFATVYDTITSLASSWDDGWKVAESSEN